MQKKSLRYVAFDPISASPLCQADTINELAQKVAKLEKTPYSEFFDMDAAIYDRNEKRWLEDSEKTVEVTEDITA